MESLLRANDVAKILGISRSQVFALWSKKELPAVRIGKLVRCRPSDLAAFIEANTVGTNKNVLIAPTTSTSISGTSHVIGDHHV